MSAHPENESAPASPGESQEPEPSTQESAPEPRSVLQSLQERSGQFAGVLLPDGDSEHGSSPIVDPASAIHHQLSPSRINYQIMGEIARGGMGIVLKGHDSDLGRDVALKVLDEELAKNPVVVQRFVEEAQIGGQLQHPGIVPVYELGLMSDERPFFTMKLVKGRTLSEFLRRRKGPSDDRGRLISIFESVCQTIAYAHSKGVLHRDIKPANIMVGAFGEVQVVDWGLAKVLTRGGVSDERRAKHEHMTVIETVRSGSSSAGSDSMVGSVMGTPAYMAPEQAQGEVEQLDERADVFSLGAVLCEILTGKPPYEDAKEEPTVLKAAKAQLEPARQRVQQCQADPALKELCLDCLMTSRESRPRNAEELASALRDHLNSIEERIQAAQLAAAEERIKATEARRAKRLTVALATAFALVLIVGAGGFLWIKSERSARIDELKASIEFETTQALGLLQQGEFENALSSAERGVELADNELLGYHDLERAQEFRSQIVQARDQAAQELAERQKDEAFLLALRSTADSLADAVMNEQLTNRVTNRFSELFAEYGFDMSSTDLVPALEHFRARGIGLEIAETLDLWTQGEMILSSGRTPEMESLVFLALDLDDDPDRLRMREALLAEDEAALIELMRQEGSENFRPSTCFLLVSSLFEIDRRNGPEAAKFLFRARAAQPSSFLLQLLCGITSESYSIDHTGALLSFGAAVSLRPDSAIVRVRMSNSLTKLGRMTEALHHSRIATQLAPDDLNAHLRLGFVQVILGHLEEAKLSFQQANRLGIDDSNAIHEHSVDYHLGSISAEKIQELANATDDWNQFGVLASSLVDHPREDRIEPSLCLELLDQLARESPANAQNYVSVRALAFLQLGDAQAAKELLDSHRAGSGFEPLSTVAMQYLRAVVDWRAGEPERALLTLDQAETDWELITRNDEFEEWSQSDVVHWRHIARSELGR